MANAYLTNSNELEKVLIVIVDLKSEPSKWTNNDVLNEMKELVVASGAEVVDHVVCRVQKTSPKNLIGDTKIDDIVAVRDLNHVDTIVFSHELKGNQQRNLEDALSVKTIDRTQLILDIFARHASSKAGKMQVELAQLEYLLPRLVGKGIELSRLGGGIGTLGPGETKLEVDRRRIGQRVSKLKRDLKQVVQNRQLTRKRRTERGIPSVSLVGYTNAGKSTLLNTLTESEQVTRNGMFTTLDSLSRQMVLPNHQKVVLSDTVGFMHELPHNLIESFKATLEEVQVADLLLHVLDISHKNFRLLFESVQQVLGELQVADKPVVVVLNKIDQLDDVSWVDSFKENFEHAVPVSALTGVGIPELQSKLEELLVSLFVEIHVDLPLKRMDLVNLAHEEGEVYSVKYYNDRINIRASIPSNLVGKFNL